MVDKLAKNLLADQICRNCRWFEAEQGDIMYCAIDEVEDGKPYEGTKPFPDIGTCDRWTVNKTCDNCKHIEYEGDTIEICHADGGYGIPAYTTMRPIPEERICGKWEAYVSR